MKRTSLAGLSALVLTSLILSGCAAKVAPVAICPPIQIPARPDPPRVVLPATTNGVYCLTQPQVEALAKGIKDLKAYADELTAGVNAYNRVYTQSEERSAPLP